jgi:PKD domain/IPT/TIG domain
MDEGMRVGVLRRALLALLALAAASLVAALSAPGAFAIIAHLKDGRAISFEAPPGSRRPSPFDAMFTNLDYNGGAVMASNTNYVIYWAPLGAPAFPTDYQPGIDRYFEDLAHDSGAHSNVDSITAQYNDTSSNAAYDSHFAGAIIDTNPYPASGCSEATICLSDAQIRAELSAYVSAHGLPTDLTHEYFLLTPAGVASCFEGSCSAGTPHPGFCAYHASTALSTGGELIYANIPFLAGGICDDGNHPNGTSADASLSAISHEHNESLSDPVPNTAWTDWATGEATGWESADKCRVFEAPREFGPPLGTAPNGASYNQLINGHEYWTQQLWSNAGHACLQRLAPGGESPTASFTSTYLGGSRVSFDAGAASAPAGIAAYEWQFNDGGAPQESTSATITHEFPSQGVWNVALTVFSANGASSGSARSVVAAPVTLPSVTKVSPRKGPATGGTRVTIVGVNLSEVSAVHFGTLSAASFNVIAANKITAVTPAGTAGKLAVTVTTSQGTSATTTADLFKLGPPTVTKLTPGSGPLAGGTLISVTGSGFALGAGTHFKFGRVRAGEVSCSSSSACSVRSPPGSATGNVDVVASVAGSAGKANPATDLFSYR